MYIFVQDIIFKENVFILNLIRYFNRIFLWYAEGLVKANIFLLFITEGLRIILALLNVLHIIVVVVIIITRIIIVWLALEKY